MQSISKKYTTPSSTPNEIESPDIQLSDLLVTPAQVCILLENDPPSTMAVADGMLPFILKNCGVTLAPLVHLVFSNMLSLRKWPTICKCSLITPIHKKESKNNVENYRPIFISKFLYSKSHCKLSNRQQGFENSTQQLLNCSGFLTNLMPTMTRTSNRLSSTWILQKLLTM